jgi:serine/threonine protein kinase
MQQVYVARDKTFEREIALKVPKNLSAEKRFQRSASMSARVNHENVAKTLDYFEFEGRGHLVEELVPGQHLGWHLENTFYYLDPHLAAKIFCSIIRGIAASHHANVLHRDLKPSNILVSVDPNVSTVKITDFGIAKLALEEFAGIDLEDQGSITGSQTVLGALPYMAPEMIESAKAAKLPADIWAVGAMLYKLLTGSLPFGTGLKAVANILEAKVPPAPHLFGLKTQFTLLSTELWNMVIACLNKDPEKRPTADQLLAQCSALCFSTAPRRIGEVVELRFASQGFIRGDDGAKSFFHFDSVFGPTVKVGTRVNFASFPGSPYQRAFPVLPIRPLPSSSTN